MNRPVKLGLLLIAIFASPLPCLPASGEKADTVLGTWEGESICTVRPSPCHDEHVIYQISKTENAEQFTIAMDKVVAGERQSVGSLLCRYEPGHLFCRYRDDHWDYTIEGRKMAGTLALSDGRLYRRINVSKK